MTHSESRFKGDRYQRLIQGAAVLSADPAVREGSFPFNSNGLHTFVSAIVARRILDDLSERDADLVAMMLLLDFHLGPDQMVWRINDVLSTDSEQRRGGDKHAVAAALAAAHEVATAAAAASSDR